MARGDSAMILEECAILSSERRVSSRATPGFSTQLTRRPERRTIRISDSTTASTHRRRSWTMRSTCEAPSISTHSHE